MGLGLRKLKSEKDIKGKLRKQPRASEDGPTESTRHQRIPSIAPVLTLPSHIKTTLPTTNSDPSSLHLRAGPTSRTKTSNHHHRRSRSFSALTSLISPTLSSFADQPWRSRDAWLAIHGRPPSPPPITAHPSTRGETDGGWRRKGNGGFFARELAGVGETALPLPTATRPGAARSQTVNDLAGELERPEIKRQASEPTPVEVQAEENAADGVPELTNWQPGFATSLFRRKTQRVSQCAASSPEVDAEEIVTPPPPMASRPESRILPDSPPPPPAYRRPRKATNTSAYPPVRTASTGSVSIRTSQSSSLHTCESAELHYHSLDTGEHSIHPPVPTIKASEDYPRSSGYTTRSSRSSAVLDGLPTRTSSLLSPEDLPTIITPTSTYYHFTSPRCSTDDPHRVDFSARRGSTDSTPIAEQAGFEQSAFPPRPDPRSLRHRQPLSAKHPYQQHGRDESLPALLPSADIPAREGREFQPGQVLGGLRTKGVPWAKAQGSGEGGVAERRGSLVPRAPSRQRVMDRVRELDEGQQAAPSSRLSGAEKGRRGSEAREAVRGGWV